MSKSESGSPLKQNKFSLQILRFNLIVRFPFILIGLIGHLLSGLMVTCFTWELGGGAVLPGGEIFSETVISILVDND